MRKTVEVTTDERTTIIQADNARVTACVLLAALGLAVYYRSVFLGQGLREFLDILIIFLAGVVIQFVLDFWRGAVTRVSVRPYHFLALGIGGPILYGVDRLIGGAPLAETAGRSLSFAVLIVVLLLLLRAWVDRPRGPAPPTDL